MQINNKYRKNLKIQCIYITNTEKNMKIQCIYITSTEKTMKIQWKYRKYEEKKHENTIRIHNKSICTNLLLQPTSNMLRTKQTDKHENRMLLHLCPNNTKHIGNFWVLILVKRPLGKCFLLPCQLDWLLVLYLYLRPAQFKINIF